MFQKYADAGKQHIEENIEEFFGALGINMENIEALIVMCKMGCKVQGKVLYSEFE